ncbi:MAG: RusA family crossover junction endodeoxyribonuclease [Flavisolibacter sp.]
MKVKVFPNPVFDFTIGYIGSVEDVPTKQDKFKPVQYINIQCEDENGNKLPIKKELYIVNERITEGQKNFAEQLTQIIKNSLSEDHPYKKTTELEVVIGVNTTRKRFKEVDVDNLVKYILDCLNGLVYEDDSQIASLIASKYVIEDNSIYQQLGVVIGIRVLKEDRKLLNNIPIYLWENVYEETEQTKLPKIQSS